jgi:uncharacterized protein YkwD
MRKHPGFAAMGYTLISPYLRVARTIAAIGALCCISIAAVEATPFHAPDLTLADARQYMLELINRDRVSAGLRPVKLDLVATTAGQKHTDEMAANRYMAHVNLEGKLPDQRYSELGGTDYVRENIYLQSRGKNAGPGRFELVANATFSRRELEDIEAAYFNEVPPNDGHRRNILRPEHTHVGVGLSRAESAAGETLSNSQEFVDRYAETVEPLPGAASVGSLVTVAGRTAPGASLKGISLARGPVPRSMTVEELKATRKYNVPAAFVTYWPEPYESPIPVSVTQDGRFRVTIPLTDGAQPGLYYVTIWMKDNTGRDVIGSQRTVVVK